MRDIGTFDSSIHLLVTELGEDSDQTAEAVDDLSALHDRLVDVTKEMFDPLLED